MAYTKTGKKLLIVNILDILRTYTDEAHRLSQKEIADILRTQYDMPVERKAVKRNLMDLIEFGYEIEYSEIIRMTPNPKTGEPEENRILTDFYLVRDFTDGELYDFILREYTHLRFSPAVEADVHHAADNPKRRQRNARRLLEKSGVGTKSQQALQKQYEEMKTERKEKSREIREAEKQRQFELRQQKKKEKHRGH